MPVFLLSLCLALPLSAQQRPRQNSPVVGYAYPAGGQAGTTVEVTVGGMGLGGARAAVYSGGDLPTTFVKHIRPISGVVQTKIRDAIKAERDKAVAERAAARDGATAAAAKRRFVTDEEIVTTLLERGDFTQDEVDGFIEMLRQRRDPKRQPNAQLAERVILRVTIPSDAPAGRRELRLRGPTGLSNPLVFMVGKIPEILESEPNSPPDATAQAVSMPAVINGVILPGDVDCFTFEARKGTRLTVAVAARELTPYLADAVPGWFQAVVTLTAPDGRQAGFSGSFDHRPDPLLTTTLTADGPHTLRIHDAIFRGREDFVYRITLGEIPCLTEQFPLGGRVGSTVPVRVAGWNHADYTTTIEAGLEPGRRQLQPRPPLLGFLHFETGNHPEIIEADADDTTAGPREVEFPSTVNGIIGRPGERDHYAVHLQQGKVVVAEVSARRLGSPLDAMLRVIGPGGEILAHNDDFDDPASGLLTHHADPRVEFTAPADGVYQIEISDAQGRGKRGFSYRCSIAPLAPGFSLRLTPSALSGRAGALVPLTAHIIRHDGFTGEVDLALTGAPPGFALAGGKIPAGADSVQLTLRLPNKASPGVTPLRVVGSAQVGGQTVIRTAQPADDRMQAFFYRHLVPADELLACVTARANAPNRR